MSLSPEEIVEQLIAWRLMPAREGALWRHRLRKEPRLRRGERFLKQLVAGGQLTQYQAAKIQRGRLDALVIGDYVLAERLGAGAMGRVYRAWDRPRRRWVALKVLRSQWTDSPRHLERFQREVRAARRLRHPNIVRALDSGRDGETHFLAMEYVDGPNLEAYLHEHGPLSVAQAVNIVMQTAGALSYAHAKGVVHRDIKPSNLLVGPGGEIKILDMGIARVAAAADDPASERLTHSGQLLGTPHYMAPEQALDPKNASPECDIYALGCTLYRMLAGEMPYAGESDFDVLLAHLRAPIPSLREKRSDVPRQLDAICRRMMAKNIEHRYASLRAVIGDLELAPLPAAAAASRPTADKASPVSDTVTAIASSPLAPVRRSRWRTEDDEATLAAVPAAAIAGPPLAVVARVWPAASEMPRERELPASSVPPQQPCIPVETAAPAPVNVRPRRRTRNSLSAGVACVAASIAIAAGLGLAARLDRGGSVSLEVYPGDALVEVFDESSVLELRQLAADEVNFHAAPGLYRLRITKQGFAPYIRDFALESGGRTTIRAILERE
ncbi:MAG: serine/threonine protein kinase [Planctomycetes bacterium]|nr:serine/threonine protein kinase [Planctomycetota bacterium]